MPRMRIMVVFEVREIDREQGKERLEKSLFHELFQKEKVND